MARDPMDPLGLFDGPATGGAPDPMDPLGLFTGQPAAPAEEGTTFADYVRAAGAGVGELISGVGYVLPGRPGVAAQEFGTGVAEYWREGMSPAARAEMAKQFVVQDPETGDLSMGDASLATAGLMAAGSLPGTAAGMGLGALATKGVGLFLSNFPKIAGALGFGAGEGAVSGVMNAQQTARAILEAPAEQIAKAPGFAEVYWDPQFDDLEHEARFQAARELLASTVAPEVGVETGLTTGALGAPMGALLGPVVTRGLPLAGSRAGAIALGGAGEAAQEAAQSGVESVLGNVAAQQNYDPTRGTFEGTANQMVGGAAAGGLMGAAVGGLAGADPQQQAGAPPPVPVSPPRSAAEMGVQPEPVGADRPIMDMVREKVGPDADALVGQALGGVVQLAPYAPPVQPPPAPVAPPPIPAQPAPGAVVPFIPTHTTSEGTRVQETEAPGVYVDAQGVEVEDPAAEPLAAPTVEPAAPALAEAPVAPTVEPTEPAQARAPRETPEVPRAQEVRSDQGQVPETGRQEEGVPVEGRQDLQRPAQIGPEADRPPQQITAEPAARPPTDSLQPVIAQAKQRHSRKDGYLSYLRGRLGRERFETNREAIESAWEAPQMSRRVPAPSGRPLGQIMLAPEEVELADGTTATVERSAEAALADVDERVEALRAVLDCLGAAA